MARDTPVDQAPTASRHDCPVAISFTVPAAILTVKGM
jgi:hypothetical protein